MISEPEDQTLLEEIQEEIQDWFDPETSFWTCSWLKITIAKLGAMALAALLILLAGCWIRRRSRYVGDVRHSQYLDVCGSSGLNVGADGKWHYFFQGKYKTVQNKFWQG